MYEVDKTGWVRTPENVERYEDEFWYRQKIKFSRVKHYLTHKFTWKFWLWLILMITGWTLVIKSLTNPQQLNNLNLIAIGIFLICILLCFCGLYNEE
jgi:hypothetical protein